MSGARPIDGELTVHSVTFTDEGIAIAYMEVPTDVRVEGRVIQTHTIQLHASHPDYRDDMEGLQARIRKIVRNALEDFHESEPFDPTAELEDPDDERGMGE